MQDTLDAHKEFLDNQTTQAPIEQQPVNTNDAEMTVDEELERVKVENDDQQSVSEEEQGVDLQQEGKEQEGNHQPQTHSGSDEAEAEGEKNQPPLVRSSPGADAFMMAGPGPLVTELEDAEPLDTVHLPLLIDDLPDLEDVDMEEYAEMFFSQPSSKPKIEILSGGGDEDEAVHIWSDDTPSLHPEKESVLWTIGGDVPDEQLSRSSLVYPEDGDGRELQTPEPEAKIQTGQDPAPPLCLIEELE